MTETLKKALERAKNGVIQLGTANGWGAESNALYKELSELRVPETGKERNLGRCYNEYSFDVKIEEQIFQVVYSVDSGD